MSHRSISIYLLGIALILGGCSSGKKGENKVHEIPVRTVIAGEDKNADVRGYVGVAEEELSSSVSFSTNGTIERMYAVEGQRVSAGEVLAELNTSNLKNTYAAARAMLDQAEDAMSRMQMLYDNESIPEVKYIEMKTELEKAKSMEAIAKKNLDDSRLKAPFSGIIGRKKAEAGENVLPNQAVYTLLKMDRTVMVKVSVPEKEISRVEPGQHAAIMVPALEDERFDGVVAEKGVAADPVSHTYGIRIRVDNTGRRLLPGMVCKVTMEDGADEREAIVLPANAVQKSGGSDKYVWRVVDGAPVRQPVCTGRITGKGVEIISGLQGGEEIVTEGYQALFEGAKIRIL